MPIVKCDYCGKEVERSSWTLKEHKTHFCSRKCQYKAQEQNNIILSKDNHAEMIIIKNDKKYVVLISKEDIEKVNQVKWMLKYDATLKGYYVQGHDRGVKEKDRKTFRLHRFLFNNPEGKVIDHINRNTLDNRRENLRVVTNMQNAQNKGFYANNKSGYKYIHWSKANKTFVCEIKRYKKIVFRKSCKNLENLAEMRNEFIKENIGLWR